MTLPGGRVVSHATASQTFADVIRILGVDRVRRLNKTMNGHPLVSPHRHATYSQSRVGDQWVMTHSNTATKRDVLESIAEALNVILIVKIIP